MAKKIFIIYSFLILLIPNVILCFTEHPGVLGALCNILLPGAFILFMLTLTRHIGMNIWLLFPYFFFAAFQIVLLQLYGRSIIAVDMFLNLVTTNPTEVTELLGNLLPVVVFVFALYLPVLVAGGVMWYKKTSLERPFVRHSRIAASVMAVIGIVSFGVISASGQNHSLKNDIFPVNVCYNVYLAVDRTIKTGEYHETSKDFTFNATTTHPADSAEIYIAIIGETSRADNWEILGYGRHTNPCLSRRDDIFTSSRTYSESNTTHKSVPMLLSPVSAKNFDTDIYKTKSLVSAFKEAGFTTAFISAQRHNHSFIDFFSEEADTTLFFKESPLFENTADTPDDLRLLGIMDGIIREGHRKLLVVLHAYGSHFNYRDRYKGMTPVFTPDDYSEAIKTNRHQLINAYDNTIIVTDRLISECISRLDSVSGLLGGVIYTSDHGEDIFDDGKDYFLHASPLPTIHQVHVPFLVWMTRDLTRQHPESVAALRRNIDGQVSSSQSYTPTLLMMAGIKSDRVDSSQSLLSPDYNHEETVYLNDHNECVKLSELL